MFVQNTSLTQAFQNFFLSKKLVFLLVLLLWWASSLAFSVNRLVQRFKMVKFPFMCSVLIWCAISTVMASGVFFPGTLRFVLHCFQKSLLYRFLVSLQLAPGSLQMNFWWTFLREQYLFVCGYYIVSSVDVFVVAPERFPSLQTCKSSWESWACTNRGFEDWFSMPKPSRSVRFCCQTQRWRVRSAGE